MKRLGVCVFALAVAVGTARGAVLDQSQEALTGRTTVDVYGSSYVQTFTCGISGKLDHIDLHVQGWEGTGDPGYPTTVAILTVESGEPGSTTLGQVDSCIFELGWNSVDFSSQAVFLSAGTQYGILVENDDANLSGEPTLELSFDWGHDGDPYAGGSLWKGPYGDPPAWHDDYEWIPSNAPVDATFRTYMVTVPELGPIAHWKLDEGEGLTAYDSAGNNDGTLLGGPTWTASGIDGSLIFDGVDDYVTVPGDSSLNPTSQIAISVWVKPTDWTAGHRRIIQKGFADDQYRFYALGESLDLDLTGLSSGPISTYLPSLNEWHHLVGTYDGSEVSIFIDGQQAHSEAASGSINVTTDELNIGVSRPDLAPPGDYFAGLMDDVRIYNRGLSGEEIAELYLSATPVNYYYVDGVDGDDLNDGLTPATAFETIQKGVDEANDADTVVVYPALYIDPVDFDGKAITVRGLVTEAGAPTVETPMDYAFSFYNDEEPNSILTNFLIRDSFLAAFLIDSAPTISNLTVVDNRFGIEAYAGAQPNITNCIFYNNTNGDLSGCYAQYSFVEDGITDGLIAHWRLDEGTGTTAYDSAGTNHGTLLNSPTWTTGILGGALDFDGVNAYVDCGNDPSLYPAELTLAAWVFPRTAGEAGAGRIIANDKSGSIKSYALSMYGNNLYSCLYLSEVPGVITTTDDNPVPFNEWHYVSLTYNGSEVKIYADGMEKAAKPGLSGAVPVGSEVCIGDGGDLYRNFDGLIDDVRIYNRALSAEEVRQVYLQGVGPRFVDPCSGDYHLKSEGWSWSRSGWTWDDVTSWCIDSGNPGTPLRDEPMSIPRDPDNIYGVNVRVNMGVYGGTSQASMPPHGWALLADLDNDGIVDWLDVALYAACWLSADYEPAGDLNRDGIVNMADWALLLADWQQETIW